MSDQEKPDQEKARDQERERESDQENKPGHKPEDVPLFDQDQVRSHR